MGSDVSLWWEIGGCVLGLCLGFALVISAEWLTERRYQARAKSLSARSTIGYPDARPTEEDVARVVASFRAAGGQHPRVTMAPCHLAGFVYSLGARLTFDVTCPPDTLYVFEDAR